MILDIGHVSKHDLSRKSLERNGHYGILEQDFTQLIEPAFNRVGLRDNKDISKSVMVTGLEADRLQESLSKTVTPMWTQDPRFRHLLLSIQRLTQAASQKEHQEKLDGEKPTLTVESTGSQMSSVAEIEAMLVARLSKLLYIEENSLDRKQSLRNYGVDSMVAAEFRAFIFATWSFEISFMDLIGPEMTAELLAEQITAYVGRK
jgi:hypothetical protein